MSLSKCRVKEREAGPCSEGQVDSVPLSHCPECSNCGTEVSGNRFLAELPGSGNCLGLLPELSQNRPGTFMF